MISNLIQLHLMPLIMVGQNLQERHAELLAAADFEISQRAEGEVEAILAHLSHQNDLILEVLRRIEPVDARVAGGWAAGGGARRNGAPSQDGG